MTHQRSNYWKPVTSAWVGNVVPTKAYRLAAVVQGREEGGFNRINTSDLTTSGIGLKLLPV
ncbi:hypothetical protein NC651_021947 [Populus alba x Populus x berolinensis]|nr:hypothetical protein NC651_021947 [Populus alba x Populus x berolinensis]